MGDRPPASSSTVAHRMSIHPRRDTGPEMAIRRRLHAAGLRYRVCLKVPGAPRRTIDIAFTRQKLAVLVDGCFWHGCSEHRGAVPASNSAWWKKKIDRNRDRDRDTDELLRVAGWTVVRIWEHEDPDEAVALIRGRLQGRGVLGRQENVGQPKQQCD